MIRRLALLGLLTVAFMLGGRASAQSTDPLELDAVLDGRDVATADSENPIPLDPTKEIPKQ